MNVAVAVVAIFFAGMGVAALVKPALIWKPFGVAPTTPAARNEVRAVYGGFGLAVAALLIAADSATAGFRDGVLVSVAVALGGMAAGRLLGALFEPKPLLRWPGFFLLVEAALAGLLLTAR
ncbi:DUF4345 domain-containing protein [Kribbella antibiotica]|uniref:DUF4345 domain-containing protein n=1 Tax=Kribbella antibiotica TaxID=190195 RepID=A0A4R4YH38_9ACTN|nr:DUF4345 family protein [Kribbella antibiotica]TDD44181.1 DUF4345 domain-containing protein [Kribbella antibiotica]